MLFRIESIAETGIKSTPAMSTTPRKYWVSAIVEYVDNVNNTKKTHIYAFFHNQNFC